MKLTNTDRVPRQIVFTSKLNNIAILKAAKMGVTVPEYVRYLILQDNRQVFNDVPVISAETEALLEHSLQEYNKGNYADLETDEDIDKSLD